MSQTNTYIPTKGLRCPPASDAAGVLGGMAFHGRNTPVKGSGAPPPDGLEAEKVRMKAWSPERSPLLNSHDVLCQGGIRSASLPQERPLTGTSKRMLDARCTPWKADHLNPGANTVTATNYALDGEKGSLSYRQKAFGESYRGYEDTKSRVLTHCGPFEGVGTKDEDKWSINTPQKKQVPTKPASNADVIQYRYSGGICLPGYKLDVRRNGSPTVDIKNGGTMRKMAEESRVVCSSGRARGGLNSSMN